MQPTTENEYDEQQEFDKGTQFLFLIKITRYVFERIHT